MKKGFLGETKVLLQGLIAKSPRPLDEVTFRSRCAYWKSQVAGLPFTEEHEAALCFLYVAPALSYIKVHAWEDSVSPVPMVIELGMTPEGACFRHFIKTPDGGLHMISADLRDAAAIAHVIAKNDDLSCPPLRGRLIQAIHHETLEELYRRGNPASIAGRTSGERIRRVFGEEPVDMSDRLQLADDSSPWMHE